MRRRRLLPGAAAASRRCAARPPLNGTAPKGDAFNPGKTGTLNQEALRSVRLPKVFSIFIPGPAQIVTNYRLRTAIAGQVTRAAPALTAPPSRADTMRAF